MSEPLETEKSSSHIVETFILEKLETHGNADSLSLVKIPNTDYVCVVRTDDWKDKIGTLAAWIPPDSLVDTTKPLFVFLAKDGSRIRARRFRGVQSYGLLVPAPDGLNPGDDAAASLGVEHYEPETYTTHSKDPSHKPYTMAGDDSARAPKGVYPKYDLLNILKVGRKLFVDGEPVVLTEKLHGCNARLVYRDGKMHCGSRTGWKREYPGLPPDMPILRKAWLTLKTYFRRYMGGKEVFKKVKKNLWWMALENTPTLAAFCKKYPGWCVYAECFGNVQKFRYGAKDNDVWLRAFDILIPVEGGQSRWLGAEAFLTLCQAEGVPHVPVIAKVPFDLEAIRKHSEGKSLIADHIREGCVVKSLEERHNEKFGRVAVKSINPKYLEEN